MPNAPEYINADHPIERGTDDRLGRRVFAHAIAEKVMSVPVSHGFTIALVGPWGSGKSSLLNMIQEELRTVGTDQQGLLLDKDQAKILSFNPSLFASADDLVVRFFSELSAQLGRSASTRHKEVAKALAGFGRAMAPSVPIAGAVGITEIAQAAADFWDRPPSLQLERAGLQQALGALRSRIAVFVDDIDGLEDREVKELIRLIRLTSDLPNVLFVLAFDRGRVAKHLGPTERDGRDYLDKIIHLTYELPLVRQQVLPSEFSKWVDDVIASHDVLELDREVWSRVFFEIIKPLLGNLRDVKRYINSLPVTLASVGQEVALADLLALEAVRVLRPKVFAHLKEHRAYLGQQTLETSGTLDDDQQLSQVRQKLQPLLDDNPDEERVVSAILELLFPAAAEALQIGPGGIGPRWDAGCREERRVAAAEVSRIYFQAGLDESAVPSSELAGVIDALSNEKKLEEILQSLDATKLEALFERLEDYQHEYPIAAVPVALPIFLNRVGDLRGEGRGILDVSPRMKAARVIHRLLIRVGDRNHLRSIVERTLPKLRSFSSKFALIEAVGHGERVGHGLLDESAAEQIEAALVNELRAASSADLSLEWDLAGVVLRRHQLLRDEERQAFTATMQSHLQSDAFVLQLLSTATSLRHVHGAIEAVIAWEPLQDLLAGALDDAVARVAHSDGLASAGARGKQTVGLALKYASGWRPARMGLGSRAGLRLVSTNSRSGDPVPDRLVEGGDLSIGATTESRAAIRSNGSARAS